MSAHAPVKHSMANIEWYTPPDVVELCRAALGGRIELDPASCEAAQPIVRADRYATLGHSVVEWQADTIFCNPPSPPLEWWKQCAGARSLYGSRVAYLAYAIEQLSQIARLGYPASAVVCVPPKRIRYYASAAHLASFARKSAERAAAVAAKATIEKKQRNAIVREKSLLRIAEKLDAQPPGSLHPGEAPPHSSAIVLLGADPLPFARAGWAVMAVQS